MEIMAKGRRDTSKDGFKSKLLRFALTHFKYLWRFVQSVRPLKRRINRFLINSAIYRIPTRPYPFSLMTMEPHTQGTYTSWDSLTDRTYVGRHLPPDPEFNKDDSLPKLDDLAVLFQKRDGQTIYSKRSTLLLPAWVQWFTDGFLRTDQHNRLKNTSNHHIDLSPVYGLHKDSTDLLRSHMAGKLKSQVINDEEYPFFIYANPEKGTIKQEFIGLYEPLNDEKRLAAATKAKLFAMGVERANVQVGYVMFNVLCLREHNRLATLLTEHYPEWDDERLFQTARNIMIVLIMKIVVGEYIHHLSPIHFNFIVDPPSFSNEKWYRTNWMTAEFGIVYRWHSALPENLTYDGKQIPAVDTLWENRLLINKGLGSLFEEICAQPSTRIGLFNTAPFLIDVEKAGIQLGRQFQLASYNDYREMCHFPRVTDFNQITADEYVQQELKRLYGHVDRIEFYVGLFAEDIGGNAALAPLILRLVGIDAFSQILTNPLLAEGIYNKQTFSPIGWDVIQNTNTLSDLVNRNVPQKDRKFKVTFERDQGSSS